MNIENKKNRLMIIDDSVEVIRTLSSFLKNDYKIDFATDGESGISIIKEREPDIILLDIMMNPMDGYEVCKKIKSDPSICDIPIIFVTAVSEAMDEAKGFKLGGADYITKPFVPEVVVARIKHHVQLAVSLSELKRLYSLALDSNPITKWPGNTSIYKKIDKLLHEETSDHCVLYFDLDNFKAYNDKYGFAKGDEILLATADLMKSIAKKMGLEDTFFGHIGGDDFIVILESKYSENYIKRYITEFDNIIQSFYLQEDLDAGYIIGKSRNGEVTKFPLVSISIAGVDLGSKIYHNYIQISDICSEIKTIVKKKNGSNYMIDRRKN